MKKNIITKLVIVNVDKKIETWAIAGNTAELVDPNKKIGNALYRFESFLHDVGFRIIVPEEAHIVQLTIVKSTKLESAEEQYRNCLRWEELAKLWDIPEAFVQIIAWNKYPKLARRIDSMEIIISRTECRKFTPAMQA